MWKMDGLAWLIVLGVTLVLLACAWPLLAHWKPDPAYSLPVTKGDLYVCTFLVIAFGRR